MVKSLKRCRPASCKVSNGGKVSNSTKNCESIGTARGFGRKKFVSPVGEEQVEECPNAVLLVNEDHLSKQHEELRCWQLASLTKNHKLSWRQCCGRIQAPFSKLV